MFFWLVICLGLLMRDLWMPRRPARTGQRPETPLVMLWPACWPCGTSCASCRATASDGAAGPSPEVEEYRRKIRAMSRDGPEGDRPAIQLRRPAARREYPPHREPAVPGIFLTAEWRHLLMVNYVVDPAVLEPLVPAGTELDLWQGRAYVSVVGFRFLRTRVLGMPIPFHRNFDEVNLRFYVRRRRWRRLATRASRSSRRSFPAGRSRSSPARSTTRITFAMPMRSSVTIPGPVRYEWCARGDWEGVSANVVGEPTCPGRMPRRRSSASTTGATPGSADGSTIEYGVEHPPWRVWHCESAGSGLPGRFALRRAIRPVSGRAAGVGVPGRRLAGHRPAWGPLTVEEDRLCEPSTSTASAASAAT